MSRKKVIASFAPTKFKVNMYKKLCLFIVIATSTAFFSKAAVCETIPATGQIEVAFSPNEGSEALVIKVIDSAKKEILLLAYSFTSAPVVEALVTASHRGVAVHIVVDEKDNIQEDRSGKSRSALSALKNAGADVRVISIYPIHHDKVILVDRQTVELGSFNYSSAAAHKNSENVFVNWGNHDLASTYLKHFERNYQLSTPYSERY